MLTQVSFHLRGLAPLLIHSERSANPLDPEVAAHKRLSQKRKKTDDELKELIRSEWFLALYVDDSLRPVMPADNVMAALKAAAGLRRMKRQLAAAVFADALHWPLIYDGPATSEELWDDGGFLDIRSVGVNGKRIMRARPIFHSWELAGSLTLENDILSFEDFRSIFEQAGAMCGLCERRPNYGRFAVEDVTATAHDLAVAAE